jgi:Fe2+ or Zn2+ uptake regulation protein
MNYKEMLKSYEISPSIQRIKILEYFFQYRSHPTIEEIYSKLLHEIPTLSKTTVYNTLKMFQEKGLIEVVPSNTNDTHYDLAIDGHDHFRCMSCGKIFDIYEQNKEQPHEIDGHKIENMHISYRGICKTCREGK